MITVQDILDADSARIVDGTREPLLTPAGRALLQQIIAMTQPMPQAEIDSIIRETLQRPQLQLKLA